MSGSRLTRKVTVEASKKISESSAPRKSVFDRLGPGTLERSAKRDDYHDQPQGEKCRYWERDGRCQFGSKCRYEHGSNTDSKSQVKIVRSFLSNPDESDEGKGEMKHSTSMKDDDLYEHSSKKSSKKHKPDKFKSITDHLKGTNSYQDAKMRDQRREKQAIAAKKKELAITRSASSSGWNLQDHSESDEGDDPKQLDWEERGALNYNRGVALEERRNALRQQIANIDDIADVPANKAMVPGSRVMKQEPTIINSTNDDIKPKKKKTKSEKSKKKSKKKSHKNESVRNEIEEVRVENEIIQKAQVVPKKKKKHHNERAEFQAPIPQPMKHDFLQHGHFQDPRNDLFQSETNKKQRKGVEEREEPLNRPTFQPDMFAKHDEDMFRADYGDDRKRFKEGDMMSRDGNMEVRSKGERRKARDDPGMQSREMPRFIPRSIEQKEEKHRIRKVEKREKTKEASLYSSQFPRDEWNRDEKFSRNEDVRSRGPRTPSPEMKRDQNSEREASLKHTWKSEQSQRQESSTRNTPPLVKRSAFMEGRPTRTDINNSVSRESGKSAQSFHGRCDVENVSGDEMQQRSRENQKKQGKQKGTAIENVEKTKFPEHNIAETSQQQEAKQKKENERKMRSKEREKKVHSKKVDQGKGNEHPDNKRIKEVLNREQEQTKHEREGKLASRERKQANRDKEEKQEGRRTEQEIPLGERENENRSRENENSARHEEKQGKEELVQSNRREIVVKSTKTSQIVPDNQENASHTLREQDSHGREKERAGRNKEKESVKRNKEKNTGKEDENEQLDRIEHPQRDVNILMEHSEERERSLNNRKDSRSGEHYPPPTPEFDRRDDRNERRSHRKLREEQLEHRVQDNRNEKSSSQRDNRDQRDIKDHRDLPRMDSRERFPDHRDGDRPPPSDSHRNEPRDYDRPGYERAGWSRDRHGRGSYGSYDKGGGDDRRPEGRTQQERSYERDRGQPARGARYRESNDRHNGSWNERRNEKGYRDQERDRFSSVHEDTRNTKGKRQPRSPPTESTRDEKRVGRDEQEKRPLTPVEESEDWDYEEGQSPKSRSKEPSRKRPKEKSRSPKQDGAAKRKKVASPTQDKTKEEAPSDNVVTTATSVSNENDNQEEKDKKVKKEKPKKGKKRKLETETEENATTNKRKREGEVNRDKQVNRLKTKNQPEVVVRPWSDLENEVEESKVKIEEIATENTDNNMTVSNKEAKKDGVFSDWSDASEDVSNKNENNEKKNVVKPDEKNKKVNEKEKEEGDDDCSVDDVYDPISDDEFEAMFAAGDENGDDTAGGDSCEVISEKKKNIPIPCDEVDWSILASSTVPKESEPGDYIKQFSAGKIFSQIGLSSTLAGAALTKRVQERCCKDASDMKMKDLLESDHCTGAKLTIGALLSAEVRKLKERANVVNDIGPCRRALCARRDFHIRKQLRKLTSTKLGVELVLSDSSVEPVDSDLFAMSVALYRREKPTKKNDEDTIPPVIPGSSELLVC